MTSNELPQSFGDVAELEEFLSRPSEGLVETMSRLEGDVLILGVAGKMGPTMARMAVRASQAAGTSRKVIGVSRFSDPDVQAALEGQGIQTIRGDLLDREFVASLPDAPNVVSMAGMKFGATGNESLTWAMNAYLPAVVCERFRSGRIVAFSTGNVYGLVPVDGTGSVESDPPRPVGEYAMSCLGRERMYEHFSKTLGIPVSIVRLNYAVELRYGVLVDLAQQVLNRTPIDLAMGYVNVIWQGDANAMALESLEHASSPANVLNVAGPETLAVRDVVRRLGELLKTPVEFAGTPATDALLNNGSRGHELYGPPSISSERMLEWIAEWVGKGGALLGKPTHFESRDGRF
ncbi:MAG: epimerase [Planctomycetaceae bacterium]|nr:epimerase [Planctomycetaceae bacterium]